MNIKIKGYKVTIETELNGSNYNVYVKVFAPKQKMPLCGTILKTERDAKEWAKIKVLEDLNEDMGECTNFFDALQDIDTVATQD